jgi:hypothetical protein
MREEACRERRTHDIKGEVLPRGDGSTERHHRYTVDDGARGHVACSGERGAGRVPVFKCSRAEAEARGVRSLGQARERREGRQGRTPDRRNERQRRAWPVRACSLAWRKAGLLVCAWPTGVGCGPGGFQVADTAAGREPLGRGTKSAHQAVARAATATTNPPPTARGRRIITLK